MNWIWFILNAILLFLLGLFIKSYLPKYMEEKGKNLATKEDIAEITKITEEVQKEFKVSFEQFSSDLKFKYDFYYKQYSELYSNLYSIIIQSEYVRHFVFLSDGKKLTFEEVPFLEITPTHKTTEYISFKHGESPNFQQKTEKIETPISQFNKKQLCDYIIDNGEFASQKLLKIAISYRFAYQHYAGNPEVKNSSCEDIANYEEIRLLREMVSCIVSEYNFLRKELKMEYNKEELETGLLNL